MSYFYIIKITISIHALLAESDFLMSRRNKILLLFLSTLSLRRATRSEQPSSGLNIHFYPRSPCGERPARPTANNATTIFLSTLSLRRATRALRQLQSALRHFYPRSPCGERQQQTAYFLLPDDFYPRSPCGERRITKQHFKNLPIFLSTLSLRRATVKATCMQVLFDISIHALLAESDHANRYYVGLHLISIHALLAESDDQHQERSGPVPISIHALLAESDGAIKHVHQTEEISIHALLAESDGVSTIFPA